LKKWVEWLATSRLPQHYQQLTTLLKTLVGSKWVESGWKVGSKINPKIPDAAMEKAQKGHFNKREN